MKLFDRLNHVSVIVSQTRRSRKFYAEVLQLKEIPRPNFPFNGAWFDLGHGRELHLLEGKRTHKWKKPRKWEVAYPHFALLVKDADKFFDYLKSQNIEFFDYVSTPTGQRQLYLLDPDNNMIEILGATRLIRKLVLDRRSQNRKRPNKKKTRK